MEEKKVSKPPVVLAIAGFDPSGGAGILGDIKTITAFGCYALAAVTSLTFQNTIKVLGAEHQSGATVRHQLAPLFEDFEVAAIKTGMLPSREIIEEVARTLESQRVPIVVIDPVLRSTSGFDFTDHEALDAMVTKLFPRASVVTPNVAELERITGLEIVDTMTMQRGAEMIRQMGAGAVLVTGGDQGSESSTDLLVDEIGPMFFTSKRIDSKQTHGTGCALASAIACLLAQGRPLRDSVNIAKQYLSDAISRAPGLGKGHGPVNHFPRSSDDKAL